MLKTILLLIAQEIGKLALKKLLEKIWHELNQRRFTTFFKLQLLTLYLKLILLKNPFH